MGRSALDVNLGPHHISESTGARKLRSYTVLDKAKYFFPSDNFSASGRVGVAAPLV